MFYFNNNMLTVGKFKKILLLSGNEIVFEFKRFILVVSGDGLVMPYLEDDEVGIKGVIKNINIQYKLVKNYD